MGGENGNFDPENDIMKLIKIIGSYVYYCISLFPIGAIFQTNDRIRKKLPSKNFVEIISPHKTSILNPVVLIRKRLQRKPWYHQYTSFSLYHDPL